MRIIVEPTNFCNYACLFCPRANMYRKKGFMPLSLASKIATLTSKKGADVVVLHGTGEPILHPKFDKLIKIFKKHRFKVMFSTNGSLLEPKKIQKLVRAGVDEIVFSLDGVSKCTVESLRVGAKLEEVEENLNTFLKLRKNGRPKIILQAVSTPINRAELPALVERWKNKVDLIVIKHYDTFAGQVIPLEKVFLPARRYACKSLLRGDLTFFWDGTVTACCRDINGDLVIGNIKKDSIDDILENHKKLVSLHLRGRWNEIPLCAACKEWIW